MYTPLSPHAVCAMFRSASMSNNFTFLIVIKILDYSYNNLVAIFQIRKSKISERTENVRGYFYSEASLLSLFGKACILGASVQSCSKSRILLRSNCSQLVNIQYL